MTASPEPPEPILDPDRPIVDAHHHLWLQTDAGIAALESQSSVLARAMAPVYRRNARYLLDEFAHDIGSGHKVVGTVFIQARTMYRTDGPEPLRSVGEVEFANGVAAMAASGLFGPARICAGIVGGVDLTMGEAVDEVLEAHMRAGGGRYRGVRSGTLFDADPAILGGGGRPHLLLDPAFRAGFARLHAHGLSYDALVFEPQLDELIDLAERIPDTPIIVNHVGVPIAVGCYQGQLDERFPLWREKIRALARYPQVTMKLGGLGLPFADFGARVALPAPSAALAPLWAPYIESCIEAFGADRCMFQSNFPVDSAACGYATLWNAFKRIAAGCSQDEKTALFSGTATRVYALDL